MKKQNKNAFTIVEISLAMTFLAILLVSVAVLVMRSVQIYQKGLTLRSINSAGIEIVEDMQHTIGGTSAIVDLQIADEDKDGKINFKEQRKAHESYFKSKVDVDNRQLGGIFCTGRFSYVWNTAEGSNTNNTIMLRDKGGIVKSSNGNDMVPRLVRIHDPTQQACTVDIDAEAKPIVKIDTDPDDTRSYITELISSDEHDLWLYEFNVQPIVQSQMIDQSFVSASFILATKRGGVNIKANGDYCRGDGNEHSDEFSLQDFDYCAVNKFNFSVRSSGKTDKE